MLLSIYVSLGFVAALAVVSLLTLIRLWRVSSEPVVIIGSVPIDFIEKWSYGFPVLVGVVLLRITYSRYLRCLYYTAF